VESSSPKKARGPLERALIGRLSSDGAGGYRLSEHEWPGLRRLLDQTLAGPDAWSAIRRWLQLSVAMDGALASPEVGQRMRQLLREAPGGVALVRRHLLKVGAIDDVRAFLKSEARSQTPTAPMLDRRPPRNTVRLSEFLDLAGGQGVPRVIRRDPTRWPSQDGSEKDRMSWPRE
jgi:hypothetical protein